MRNRNFQIRLNEEELDRLKELARKNHLPVSTYVRSLLMSQLDRQQES